MTTAVRWVVLGSLFAIPFIPLYVANGLFFPFITGKHFAFRILVEVALVGWALLALLDPKYRPRFSWTLVLFAALVAWMFVADMFAVNPHKAFWSNYERMDGWITLAHTFVFFVVGGAFLSAEKLWRRWWLTFSVASAFVVGYGFMQILGVFQIHQGGVRLDATMGNAAYLATYLLFAIGATVWLALTSSGARRIALWVLVAGQSYLLFLTATRGAILGFTVAAVVGIAWYTLSRPGRVRAIGIGVLVTLAVIAGSLLLARDAAWVKSEPTLARLTSISLADGSTRFSLWEMAGKGALERPVFGWGHEGFNYVFNANFNPSLYAQEPWFDRAHNIFVDWLVVGGVPAFALFLALLSGAAYAIMKREDRTERIVLISMLIAYGVQGLFVFDNLFAYVPLAMILAIAHSGSSRPIAGIERMSVLDQGTAQAVAAPVLAVVGVIMIWSVNVPSMLAANDLIQALTPWPDQGINLGAFERSVSRGGFATQEIREQWVTYASSVATMQNVPADLRTLMVRRSIEELAKEVERAPNDARLRLEYAYGFRAFGDYASALREIQLAQTLAPNKQSLLLEEGIVHWQAKNYEAARAAFQKAFTISPQFDDLALYAAAGEVRAGNAQGGKTLLMERFGTTTLNHGVLLLAYYETKDYPSLFASLRKRIEETPGDPTAYYQLANAMVEAGSLEGARAVLREALVAHPELKDQITQILTTLGQTSP